MGEEVAARPVTRSFKPRRRRLSPTRAARFEPLLTRWGLAVVGPPLDLPAVFGRDGRFVLEVGFGGGESVIELARARPDELVVAVDVHTPGLAAVLEAIDDEGLDNVRVVDGDALDLLPRLPAGSLDEIRVWFPDPWPKARQQRRRIIRADIVAAFVDRLRVGGVLHLATDIADYAEQMIAVCAAEPRLVGGPVPRPPWRPLTRYEQRGIDAGRTPLDLIAHRTPE